MTPRTRHPERQSAPALIGAGVEQVEFDRLLRGRGRFVADLAQAQGALHAAFVRSDVAAARVVSVDTTAARSAPGVVAALSGADLARSVTAIAPLGGPPEPRFAAALSVEVRQHDVPPIAIDAVRYVGEPVAVIVAADRYQAEDAAEHVTVDYAPTAAVLDAAAALVPGAPTVHPGAADNLAVRLAFEHGDLHDAAARPDAILVEATYRIARQTAASMEGRGVLARPDGGSGLDVWSSTQVPFLLRRTIAQAAGLDEDAVHVHGADVGGGFGPKAVVYGEEIAVASLAIELDRPVTWIEDRYENLTSTSQSRDQVHHARLTISRDGEILAWEDDFLIDFGAQNPWLVGVSANTALHLLGPYRIPAVRISGQGAYTHKAPTSQYRGAGRPEACFALERSLDAAADRIGIDRWRLRERNILGAGDLPHGLPVPYRDGVDVEYDGADYAKVLAEAAEIVTPGEIEAHRLRLAGSRHVGSAAAAYMEATARGPQEPESARISLQPDGRLLVAAASGPSGQGHETMLAQIAAEVTARTMQAIDVVTGSTDGLPGGFGTFASRTAALVGSALHGAATSLVEAAIAAVQEASGSGHVAHVPEGFRLDEGAEVVSWEQLAAYFADDGPLASWPLLCEVRTFAPPTVTWTMGVHVAVVAVEPESGRVDVLEYGVAHEAGRSINPRVVDGQIRGGVAQGIGGALYEAVEYDDAGQPTAVTLADYQVPGAPEVPTVRLRHLEVPSQHNPLGIRGIGESGVIASAAAIASAIETALALPGLHIDRTPIRAEDLAALVAGSAS